MRSWLNNRPLRHPLAVPVLLVAVILAVYYPALLSDIHQIDDPGLFAVYSTSQPLSAVLLPGNSYYFRPLLELSYYLDNRLWSLAPGTMHLENILLHCANSLLVYLLGRRITAGQDDKNFLIPLMAALLFALHPVNVEAVAWISGRSDPLLTFFVLSASFFWLRWLDKPHWHDMAAFLLLFGAAFLTKESALAFGVVALLLAMTWPGSATGRQRMTAVGMMAAPGVLLIILALVYRSGATGLVRFMADAHLLTARHAWQALVAFGFYARKLIVPFPLNFAITSVHPAHGLIAVACIPLIWWVLRRYRLSGLLLISAAVLILPAVLVAVKQVAWTPFAERYLYLSTAFLAFGLVAIWESWQLKYPFVLTSAFVIVICGSALGSFHRNLLWHDSQAFFEDMVAKSPKFGSAYYSLGGVLMQKGKTERAIEAFTTADRLNQRVSMRYPIKAAIMGTKLARGEYLDARRYFFQLFKIKEDAPVDFLELLYTADGKRLETIGKEGKIPLAEDLLETLGILYRMKPDPFWLYRSGQIALVAGNNGKAAEFFRKAYGAAPEDAHYKGAAKIYFQRLEADR